MGEGWEKGWSETEVGSGRPIHIAPCPLRITKLDVVFGYDPDVDGHIAYIIRPTSKIEGESQPPKS